MMLKIMKNNSEHISNVQDGSDIHCHGVDALDTETNKVCSFLIMYSSSKIECYVNICIGINFRLFDSLQKQHCLLQEVPDIYTHGPPIHLYCISYFSNLPSIHQNPFETGAKKLLSQ